jgi:Protein kinase domain
MPATTPDPDIVLGSKIGRFVVAGTLGSGGMGVVYAAHDRELDRHVALKVMRAAAATDEERMRMLREGQAMARVTHPNVITVHEVGEDRGFTFLAEELLDAGTLGSWLEQPHSHAEIVAKFELAGRGLAAAHAAGLVHRDFKPDNVLLGKDGRVRVADFGLARAVGAQDNDKDLATPRLRKPDPGAVATPMSRLTETGAVMGTPMYMAPEQHLGQRADERSDQFAFCVALYYALYGDWPFPGKTSIAVADAVIEGRMQRPPRGSNVSPRLRAILLRGLATKPADRYPSMTALLADLTKPPSHRGRNAAIAIGVAALVASAAIGGGYALREREGQATTKPIAPSAFDPKTLSGDRGVAWLATAIERGQLDDALDKYAMAGSLAQQNAAPVQASVAWSAAALLDALRGHLDVARRQWGDAEAGKSTDPIAIAWADLAAAAVARAGGELDAALARSAACAREFAQLVPELAAMCFELHGRTAADRGDLAMARSSYGDGLAIAQRAGNQARTLTLELAGAELDFDEDKLDGALANATELLKTAQTDEAPSSEAQAWVLVARAHVAKGSTQDALDDLAHTRVDAIEPIEIRLACHITRGEATAILGDDTGLAEIRAAHDEADKAGYVGIAFAAQLALVEVATYNGAADAAAQQQRLADAAKSRGYGRIAQQALTALAR